MAQANTIDAGLGTKPVPRLALTMSVPTIVAQAANASYTIIDRLFKVVFNVGLQRYGGDDYVTSITIITSLMQIVSVLTSGFQQGIQPIIGFNFGARHMERVRQAIRMAFVTQIVSATAWCRCSPHSPASWPASCSMPPTARFGEIWSRLLIQWMCRLMRCETRDGWNTSQNGCPLFRDMKEILCRWCRVVRRKRCIPAIARTATWWSTLCQGEGDDEGRGGQCGCQEQIAHGG